MNIMIRDVLALLPDGLRVSTVYISGGRIAGIDSAPEGFGVPDRTISGSGRMLIPGLVNAHGHVYMTLFRNCADDLIFSDWLFGRIMPLEDKLTGEDCYWSSMLGCLEMLSTGTTTFTDMNMFMDEAAQAALDTGIRAVLGRGLSGSPDGVDGPNPRLGQAIDAYKKWHDHDTLSFMIAPHAPYSCDEAYMRQAAATARELGLGISVHLSESLSEIESIREQYGCTPIELADRCGLLTDRTVAAHCVQITDNDIELMRSRGVSVVTNPSSNLKLANGFCPVPKLLKAGVNVALGTDSASSNNTLNMFRELSLLTLIHKGTTGDPLAVTAREGFDIATVNGAAALGLRDLGEIAVGKLADLCLIDLDRLNMRPLNDPFSALAYSANGSEVETVIVNGAIVYEDRRFTRADSEEVIYNVERICERIGTR